MTWRQPRSVDRILFHRDFNAFTGGHLKVWHYFCHARESEHLDPQIYFTPTSVMGPPNPWFGTVAPLPEWNPEAADLLFLAGLDWNAVPASNRLPVINLVQHLRHATPGDPRRDFLARRAIRIAVSHEVAEAILATGLCSGPVFTIPAGLDVDAFPPPSRERDIPVLIAGMKAPGLATAIATKLAERGVLPTVETRRLPRPEYLALLGRARIAVLLPHEQEGFFLPALEAMAMGALVICPDSIGNRSFCRDRVTCLRPAYETVVIANAVHQALALSAVEVSRILASARAEADQHRLSRERQQFLQLVDALPTLW